MEMPFDCQTVAKTQGWCLEEYPTAVVLKLGHVTESIYWRAVENTDGGLPSFSDSWWSGWGQMICISNKFPVMLMMLVCEPGFEKVGSYSKGKIWKGKLQGDLCYCWYECLCPVYRSQMYLHFLFLSFYLIPLIHPHRSFLSFYLHFHF